MYVMYVYVFVEVMVVCAETKNAKAKNCVVL